MRSELKKRIKVLLIDDNSNHLNGIKEILNLEGQFDVVAAATNADTGLVLAKKYRPDVVLTDINMPNKDGLQAIQEFTKSNLSCKVIGLSAYDDADLIFRAMKLGAKGYVLKTMASAQLIYAIEEVALGKVYLPPVLTTRFFEYFQTNAQEEQNLFNAFFLKVKIYHLFESLSSKIVDFLSDLTSFKLPISSCAVF